ncbi:MAG: phage portal protein [Hyphomicrobiaceae bacterium]|nr:phage portal protein [Hyphomicrobiaceae bacterium]
MAKRSKVGPFRTAIGNLVASAALGIGGYAGGRRDDRRGRNWRPFAGSAAADINPDNPDLRARSRDLTRNTPLASGALQTMVTGVVGTGLKFKSTLNAERLGLDEDKASALEDDIEAEFALWSEQADFTGQLHFLDLQSLAFRSELENGDVGIARRFRSAPGNPYGSCLVLIEADRIGNPRGVIDTESVKGGVVYRNGQVSGFHVADRHPGDFMAKSVNWNFVPARGKSGMWQMLLPFVPLRVGQPRGVPYFAPILHMIKQLGDFTDAEVSAAVNAAMFLGFEKPASEDSMSPLESLVDAQGGAGAATGADEVELEDLAFIRLPPGSDLQLKTPGRPNAQFDPFFIAIAKQIGVSLDLPFELLMKHFSASYSASRAAMELAWKGFTVRRAHLVRGALDPVLEMFFTEMVALGRFEAKGFFDDPITRREWMAHQWVAPTRIQIDPVKEAKADEMDVDNGFKTIEQVITERTEGDFERKHRQRAREHVKRREAGLEADAVARGANASLPQEVLQG